MAHKGAQEMGRAPGNPSWSVAVGSLLSASRREEGFP